jgi:hypothetical protein
MYIQHIQGLCQFRLSTVVHALLLVAPATTAVYSLERSYDWPPPSLSFLYFLCHGSPCPILRIFAFPWFCMTSACCLHNILYNIYGSLKAMCKSQTGVRLGKFPMVRRTLFCRRCKQKQKLTAGNQPARSHVASGPAGTHGHIFVQCQDLCFVLFFLSLILLIDKRGVGLIFIYRMVFTYYTLLQWGYFSPLSGF